MGTRESSEGAPLGASVSGYSDRWSVTAGETITFMVSADTDSSETQVVRLLHGDEHPEGPGFVEREVEAEINGVVATTVQLTRTGSYVVAPPDEQLRGAAGLLVTLSAWPTIGGPGVQTLCSLRDPAGEGWELSLSEDRILLGARMLDQTFELVGPAIALRQWVYLSALIAPGAGKLGLEVRAERGAGLSEVFSQSMSMMSGHWDGRWPVVLAARTRGGTPERPHVDACFNGKLDSLTLTVVGVKEADEVLSGRAANGAPALAWDFSREPEGHHAVDVGPNGLHGRVVNAPARLMTGRRWDGRWIDPLRAPEQWSAIHFHDDDLDDAGWSPTASWTVPDETPSGVYALRARAGASEDHIPFVVRPELGRPTADIGLLLPTFTYLAYANERVLTSALPNQLVADSPAPKPHAADRMLVDHPEWGLSIYDVDRDGSGCCYSSRLRPIPNVRPRYRFWSTGGPERFAADLYLTHFLDRHGFAADVFADEDLHRDGLSLLSLYRVILTGSHPEYFSEQMLDAMQAYLRSGGRMMYLGGNGFYWITSVDPVRPHLIEVRRGSSGTRTWTSAPGETHHSTTGEPGGLWRFRGRDPNKLVGVGFSAQADSQDPRRWVREAAGLT